MLNFKKQKLLVISPHPDDEVLGCGGLIKRIKDEGGQVYVIYLTVGTTKDHSENGGSTIQERQKEIERVAKFLKYDDYRIAFLGNNFHLRLDQIPKKDLISEIENGANISLNKTMPTIVTTPQHLDYNQDHNSCTQAVFAATRPMPDELKSLQEIVLGFESVPTADWWSAPHNTNLSVDLTDNDLETKLSALSIYKSQVRSGYHPRSLRSMRNLAYFRGMQVGKKAAEAFCCYRYII